MEFLEILQHRRSVRSYNGKPVPQEAVEKILSAALVSASSRSICPWEFIVVRKKETLQQLAKCRASSAGMLAGADCAIVVIANAERSDTWIEDSSIVMSNMHLMADHLGLGSCWVQGRLRTAPDGRDTNDYVRELLGYPETYKLEAILSLGMIDRHPAPVSLDSLAWNKVHEEVF